jgi:uncharacterized protein YdhG (YjbR/CyaY superfamily)
MRGQKRITPVSVDAYIESQPEPAQEKLQQIRSLIKKQVPAAEETISYDIPAYKLEGRILIYFAGFLKHVSIYPAPRSHPSFKEALEPYKGGKGTVQFVLDKPLPVTLIKNIIRFRAAETKAAAQLKKTSKR